MEVHHHPDLHHKKKHFKEYFLEFLMIFLAVTLGFFAENLREYINNNQQAKNNIDAIVADLKSDSIMYNEAFVSNSYCKQMSDTLITMLSEKSERTGHIYFLARSITADFIMVHPNTRTFDQL